MRKPKVTNEKNVTKKSNTEIKQKIRETKKNKGIRTVTLELSDKEYEILQKFSEYLCLDKVEPGKKKVIKTYSDIFKFLLNEFEENKPKESAQKQFYRRCCIARYHNCVSPFNTKTIIDTLNTLKIKTKSKELVELSNPEFILNKATKKSSRLKKWTEDIYHKSLDKDYVENGLKKLTKNETTEKTKKSVKKG